MKANTWPVQYGCQAKYGSVLPFSFTEHMQIRKRHQSCGHRDCCTVGHVFLWGDITIPLTVIILVVQHIACVSLWSLSLISPYLVSRSLPSSWSLLPLPPRPVPAPLWSCSYCGTQRCWRNCVRSCAIAAFCMMAACAKANCGLTASAALSTWTVSSRRYCASMHQCQGATAPPCRPLSST